MSCEKEQIIALALKGMKAREIGEVVGLEPRAVQNLISREVAAGRLPRAVQRRGKKPTRYAAYWRLRRKYGVTLGSLNQLLDGLPPKQVDWLFRQVPEDCQLIDVLRSMVTDAYFEETGDE